MHEESMKRIKKEGGREGGKGGTEGWTEGGNAFKLVNEASSHSVTLTPSPRICNLNQFIFQFLSLRFPIHRWQQWKCVSHFSHRATLITTYCQNGFIEAMIVKLSASFLPSWAWLRQVKWPSHSLALPCWGDEHSSVPLGIASFHRKGQNTHYSFRELSQFDLLLGWLTNTWPRK